VLAAVAVLSASLVNAESAQADTRSNVRVDASFIQSLQLPDGAILADTARVLVDPYLGGYAAMGLARATRYTGDPQFLRSALRWLTWYQSHMDQAGVVHNYQVVNGVMTMTEEEDSVDATSGIFLMALEEAYLASPAPSRRSMLHGFDLGIHAAVHAIDSLRDSDGMTWAKPTWLVKYLMDNAEAYGGMRAAARLALPLVDPALLLEASTSAERAQAGMQSLWNPTTQAYDWALHASGYRQVTDWRNLYPDSVEQAWVVAYSVAGPTRSRQLMARFAQSQPNWDSPTAMATFWDGTPYLHTVDFWPIAGWAFQIVGDEPRAVSGASHMREGAALIGWRPPFNSGVEGQMIVLESGARPLLAVAADEASLGLAGA
jgi:hypothetical protein